MGDVLAWKSAEEIMKILAKESALVSGMSIEEAAAAYGYTLTKSGMYVKTVADTTAIVGEAATAGEAIAGTTATGGASTTAANLTLYTTAEGTTAVGGLGSIALPIAACALAGAGGYALGNVTGEAIDKAYPDFFDGLFCSISEFLTGDERSLAFIFDKDGNAFMPEESQKAVNNYIASAITIKNPDYVQIGDCNIPFSTVSVGDMVNFHTYGLTKYYAFWRVAEVVSESPVYYCNYYHIDSDGHQGFGHYFSSKSPFQVTVQEYAQYYEDGHIDTCGQSYLKATKATTQNGKTFYGYNWSHGLVDNVFNYIGQLSLQPFNIETIKAFTSAQVMYYMLYGNITSGSKVPSISKQELPEKPKIEVPSTYPTWLPIPMPVTAPNKMPNEFPSFAPENDPNKVTPYLPQPQPYPENVPLPTPSPNPNPNPIIVPVPNYIPVPQPTPSPDLDPSAEPVPNPNPAPKPTPTPKPDDTGKTPTPILPAVPPISSEADGLLHVYNPTSAQINEFGRWLWTTFSGDLIDTIAKLFNNPMDAVIGLHELYCTPSTGSTTTIKAGFLDSGVTSRLVDSRYTEINCGAITVPEYWGNYLDYSPYTKVYCYLPFIGIVELNTDDIVGHGVQITYKIDSYNGSCVAMITTAKKQDEESVVYQFSGNCSVEVPITSGMKSAMQSALIGAATCAVGAMGAGLGGAAITDAAFVGGAKRGLNSKNTVAHSGTFGSSYGAMGIKKPYIIVKRPVQKVVHGYNKNYGYPAHSMVTIGNCSGYLRCRDFEVVSSTATEEEKKRIEVLLKEGVYV